MIGVLFGGMLNNSILQSGWAMNRNMIGLAVVAGCLVGCTEKLTYERFQTIHQAQGK